MPIYGARIAPRFSLAKHVIVAEWQGTTELGRETLDISHLHPMQVPDFLASNGVTKVIAAGVDRYLQELFSMHNIDLVWGINGNADEVMAFHLRKGLRLGMGLCPPRRKRRRYRGSHF